MNKTEKRAYEILKKQGYQVEKPIRVKYQREDFFNLWDFIAINEQQLRFIQVSEKYLSERTKEYQANFYNFPLPTKLSKEYWRWDKKNKRFVITGIEIQQEEDLISGELKDYFKETFKKYIQEKLLQIKRNLEGGQLVSAEVDLKNLIETTLGYSELWKELNKS